MPGSAIHLIIVLACMALWLRVGWGWYTVGLTRAKNAGAMAVRNIIDIAVATLAFWAIGAAILNSGAAIFGVRVGLFFDARSEATAATFMQLVLVLLATAPLTGAMAERCKFFPMLVAPVLLGGLVVPLCGAWVWSSNGWLRRIGFEDAAGASVLHVVGGMFALIGAMIAGPRSGKYNRDGSSNLIPGHNVPIVSIGVVILLAAWVPYVLGAAALHGGLAGRAAINVLLSASAGCVVAALISNVRYGKPDILLTYGGLLGGLVAITASAGNVSTVAAVAIGAVAGIFVPTMTVMIDLVWKIDDPAGGVAIHLIGGAWGTLAVGIFAPAMNAGEKLKAIGIQLLGLAVIAIVAAVFAFVLFALLRATMGLRVSEDAEYDGLDLAEHDLNAYPDFQQTMIKSYHLREA